jgi:glutamate-ammonia-ligase adenylyltransferase
MSDMNATAVRDALERARTHAPFLRRMMGREAAVSAALEAGDLTGALALAGASVATETTVAAALRGERRRLALALAVGDLSGLLSFEEVTGRLSDFADRALDRAIHAAIEERTPGVAPQGFAALALGKHGSQELNYSSDIDPILIFDPETLPRRPREEPVEAAVRIARRVVELMQTLDGDG